MSDSEFPESRIDEFARGSKEWKDYDADEVDNWFKRCMADFPDLAVVEYFIWFDKWFSQFLPHVCDECGYMKNDECSAKERDGPLMGFTQSVHRITKRTVKCSYFQSSTKLSVDRMNSRGNYVFTNMALCCYLCNTIKNNVLTFDEMKYIGQNFIKPKWQAFEGKPR